MTAAEHTHVRLGSGAPLVVIPGLTGRGGFPAWLGRWMQRQQIRGFATVFDTWFIDRRADLDVGSTIADIADGYAETLRSLFTEPVDILGISTGGSIALQLAADHPELVNRLVLVSAAHSLSDSGRTVQRAAADLLRNGRPRRAAAVFLANTAAGSASRAMRGAVGYLAPSFVVGRRDVNMLTTIAAEDEFDLLDRLPGISTRTLVAGGDHDRFYSPSLFERTANTLPNGELAMHPGGHLTTHGNPKLTQDVLRFLTSTA